MCCHSIGDFIFICVFQVSSQDGWKTLNELCEYLSPGAEAKRRRAPFFWAVLGCDFALKAAVMRLPPALLDQSRGQLSQSDGQLGNLEVQLCLQHGPKRGKWSDQRGTLISGFLNSRCLKCERGSWAKRGATRATKRARLATDGPPREVIWPIGM